MRLSKKIIVLSFCHSECSEEQHINECIQISYFVRKEKIRN